MRRVIHIVSLNTDTSYSNGLILIATYIFDIITVQSIGNIHFNAIMAETTPKHDVCIVYFLGVLVSWLCFCCTSEHVMK